MDLKVGRKALFIQGAGQEITHILGEEEKHIILDRNAVLAHF